MKQLIVFSCAPQGELLRLKRSGLPPTCSKHARGIITGFSRNSRSRLMQKIASLNKNHIPHFVTLTYPDAFPLLSGDYKYHLHHFFIALKRRFPDVGMLWKLEFQKRGAAHFHLLVWGADYSELSDFVPTAWYRIVDSGDALHLAFHRGELGNTHCVSKVRSWHGVKSYASKYLTKVEGQDVAGGRIWGVRGEIPYSVILEFKIDLKVALDFRRAFRRAHGFKSKRFGFWAYGYHVDWMLFIVTLQSMLDEDNKIPISFPPYWEEWAPPNDDDEIINIISSLYCC